MDNGEKYKRMRIINRKIKSFLLNKIKPSTKDGQLIKAVMAVKIIERGYVTDRELKLMGYKD